MYYMLFIFLTAFIFNMSISIVVNTIDEELALGIIQLNRIIPKLAKVCLRPKKY